MSYLQRQYNQIYIVNYMIKLRCTVHEVNVDESSAYKIRKLIHD